MKQLRSNQALYRDTMPLIEQLKDLINIKIVIWVSYTRQHVASNKLLAILYYMEIRCVARNQQQDVQNRKPFYFSVNSCMHTLRIVLEVCT